MAQVKIYTTTFCFFCTAAKRLFHELDIAVEEIKLDADPELRRQLSEEYNGWRTVPMIFINDEFVGGFQEVRELLQRGELLGKLERAIATPW